MRYLCARPLPPRGVARARHNLIVLDPALISFVRKSVQSIWMLETLLHVRPGAGVPVTRELALLCETLNAASRDRPITLRDAIVNSQETKPRNLANAFRFSGKGEKDI